MLSEGLWAGVLVLCPALLMISKMIMTSFSRLTELDWQSLYHLGIGWWQLLVSLKGAQRFSEVFWCWVTGGCSESLRGSTGQVPLEVLFCDQAAPSYAGNVLR